MRAGHPVDSAGHTAVPTSQNLDHIDQRFNILRALEPQSYDSHSLHSLHNSASIARAAEAGLPQFPPHSMQYCHEGYSNLAYMSQNNRQAWSHNDSNYDEIFSPIPYHPNSIVRNPPFMPEPHDNYGPPTDSSPSMFAGAVISLNSQYPHTAPRRGTYELSRNHSATDLSLNSQDYQSSSQSTSLGILTPLTDTSGSIVSGQSLLNTPYCDPRLNSNSTSPLDIGQEGFNERHPGEDRALTTGLRRRLEQEIHGLGTSPNLVGDNARGTRFSLDENTDSETLLRGQTSLYPGQQVINEPIERQSFNATPRAFDAHLLKTPTASGRPSISLDRVSSIRPS